MTQRPSTRVLILANLVPVAGVLLLQWDVLTILLLYWAENVIIGVINVFRMICAPLHTFYKGWPEPPELIEPGRENEYDRKIPGEGGRIFLIGFFMVHYGAFCYGHLSLMLGFFSGGPRPISAASSMFGLWQGSYWIGVATIAFSHLYSFFKNYIGKDEYKNASLPRLMFRPYGRIIVMQLAVIFGVILVLLLGNLVGLLLIPIAVKTFIDIRVHEKERDLFGAKADTAR